MAIVRCWNCDAENDQAATFSTCARCGRRLNRLLDPEQAIKPADDPPVGSLPWIRSMIPVGLVFVGVLHLALVVLFGVLVWPAMVYEAAHKHRGSSTDGSLLRLLASRHVGIGVLFLGLGLWARWRPRWPPVVGLVAYVALSLVEPLTHDGLLFAGVDWVDAFFRELGGGVVMIVLPVQVLCLSFLIESVKYAYWFQRLTRGGEARDDRLIVADQAHGSEAIAPCLEAAQGLWAVGFLQMLFLIAFTILYLLGRWRSATFAVSVLPFLAIGIGVVFTGLSVWASFSPYPPAVVGVVLFGGVALFELAVCYWIDLPEQHSAKVYVPYLVLVGLCVLCCLTAVRSGRRAARLARKRAGPP
jgi:hypothetical protein